MDPAATARHAALRHARRKATTQSNQKPELPTTPQTAKAAGIADKAGAVGFPHPSYAQYLVAWADVLLTGPSRPGTRAAIYQLLAGQHGLNILPGVTDPLGRTGVAIGDGGGDYLVIQPGTAKLLAYTGDPVRAKSVIPAAPGVAVYEASGWAGQLGVAP